MLVFFRNLLFGFGAFDALFLLAVFVLGSYAFFDMPLNLLVLAFSLLGLRSDDEKRQRRALFLIAWLFFVLCLTSVAFYIVPPFTPSQLKLRLVHVYGGRFFLLAFVPYLALHMRTRWEPASLWVRSVTSAGWLALKVSFWLAAVTGLMAVWHELASPHLYLSLVGLPLLSIHILSFARRMKTGPPRAEPILPVSFHQLCGGRFYLAAFAAALVVTAACPWVLPAKGGYNFVATPETLVASPAGDFSPSPARTETGAVYRSEALGQTAGCKVSSCHPTVYDEWKDSPHRNSVSPAYRECLEATVARHGVRAGRLCAGCHDPISLFSGQLDFGKPLVSPTSLREGISCLVCHRLFAAEPRPSNGALEVRFPPIYNRYVQNEFSVQTYLKEHREEFGAPGYADDRLCLACHRFQVPSEPVAARVVEEILSD